VSVYLSKPPKTEPIRYRWAFFSKSLTEQIIEFATLEIEALEPSCRAPSAAAKSNDQTTLAISPLLGRI
jgi:hypothetical protein